MVHFYYFYLSNPLSLLRYLFSIIVVVVFSSSLYLIRAHGALLGRTYLISLTHIDISLTIFSSCSPFVGKFCCKTPQFVVT